MAAQTIATREKSKWICLGILQYSKGDRKGPKLQFQLISAVKTYTHVLILIWVGFLGVCFEVEGGKINPLPKTG